MPCDPKKTLRSCYAFQEYWKDRPKKEIEWGPQNSTSEPDEHLKAAHQLLNAQCGAKGVSFPCPNCDETAIVFWNGRWACRSGNESCRKRISPILQDIILGDVASLGADPEPSVHCDICCLRLDCEIVSDYLCEKHRNMVTQTFEDYVAIFKRMSGLNG